MRCGLGELAPVARQDIVKPTLMILQPEDVVAALAEQRNELRESGVASRVLFGSVARREANAVSDIDLVSRVAGQRLDAVGQPQRCYSR